MYLGRVGACLVCGFLAFAEAHGAGTGSKLEVIGDRVNLRAAPTNNSEVVAQADYGDTLVGVELAEAGWVGVEAPGKVDLWVNAEYLDGCTTKVERLQVRTGPSLNYRVVNRLPRRSVLKLRGTQGDWVKIAPPPGSVLWVSSEFVRAVQAPAPPPTVAPTVVATVKPTPTPTPLVQVPEQAPVYQFPAALAGERLSDWQGQGRVGEFEGQLRKATVVLSRTKRYRLVRFVADGTSVIVCYLLGNESQLDSVAGSELRVKGREFRVDGIDVPVVIPEQITRFTSK